MRTRRDLPEEWAQTQSNLGVAYFNRIAGERAENVERAISALNQALSVFNHETHPVDWATIQLNLGEALHNRLYDSPAENLESAIAAFKAALDVFDCQTYPYEWALGQNNLGNVYRHRIRGERTSNLERAIEAFQDAQRVFTRESFPRDWALVQNNLGVAYYNLASKDRSANLEQAIQAYKASLSVYTRASFPEDWAKVHNNLGGAYADRVRGDHYENLRLAVQSFRAALAVYTPDRFPLEARLAAGNLARFEIERKSWSEAYAALLTAIQAGEQLYTTALTEEGKSVELGENVALYRKIVEVCLRLTPVQNTEALLHAEEARSRILRDQLGTLDFSPPANLPSSLIQQERELLQSDRRLERALRNAPDETIRQAWYNERLAIRSSLDTLWERLVQEYNAMDYVALRRGERLKLKDIKQRLSILPSSEIIKT